MRTLRCFLCAFVTGFSLFTVVFAFKHGKLLVRTNVSGADVYLQDTLLAKTDARRRLLVEQIPEGTYTVQIRKKGYIEFRSAITMTANRTVTVHATLQPEKAAAATHPEKADKPSGEKTKSSGRTVERAVRTVEHGQHPSLQPTTKSAQTGNDSNRNLKPAEPVARGPSKRVQPTSGHTLLWIALGAVVAIGMGVIWILWHRARTVRIGHEREPFSEPGYSSEPDRQPGPAPPGYATPQNEWSAPAPPTAATPPTATPERKPTPHGFMRDLRRKEELFEAGLIPESSGSEKCVSDHTASRTIIEVSKDEYRYEENSDG